MALLYVARANWSFLIPLARIVVVVVVAKTVLFESPAHGTLNAILLLALTSALALYN